MNPPNHPPAASNATSTFTLFRGLPFELQHDTWRKIDPKGIVAVSFDPIQPSTTPTAQRNFVGTKMFHAPAARTCSTSRDALKRATPIVFTGQLPGGVHYNSTDDVLYFDNVRVLHYFLAKFQTSELRNLGITRIAVGTVGVEDSIHVEDGSNCRHGVQFNYNDAMHINNGIHRIGTVQHLYVIFHPRCTERQRIMGDINSAASVQRNHWLTITQPLIAAGHAVYTPSTPTTTDATRGRLMNIHL